jgi:hypothetical protein
MVAAHNGTTKGQATMTTTLEMATPVSDVMDSYANVDCIHPAYGLALELIRGDTPVMLHGDPGTAKSAMMRRAARELGRVYIDIRLSQRDTVDLRGIPEIVNGRTVFNPPAEFPREDGRAYLVAWDEINQAPPSLQATAFQAIQERRIADYEFPRDTRMVAMGNYSHNKAGVQRLSSPLANRFAHIDVAADKDSALHFWTQINAPLLLIQYMTFAPQRLHVMVDGARQFPTQRTWTEAAKYMNLPAARRRNAVASIVGEPDADQFESFARIVGELDAPDVICKNPQGARVPRVEGGTAEERQRAVAACYGVTVALAYYATKPTVRAAAEYMMRLPQDYRALFATLILKRDAALASYGLSKIIPSAS